MFVWVRVAAVPLRGDPRRVTAAARTTTHTHTHTHPHKRTCQLNAGVSVRLMRSTVRVMGCSDASSVR